MKIMTQLDIKEEEMADFWSRNINEVNTLISQYRTGAQQQMKLSIYDGNVFSHCLLCILASFLFSSRHTTIAFALISEDISSSWKN